MFLASVDTIRQQLGYDEMDDINAAIEMALDAVTPQLESVLQTRFPREQVTDIFYVPAPTYIHGSHYETQFKLSRGFLASEPETSVDGLIYDLEKGFAKDYKTYYSRSRVEFTYEAGFDPDPNNPKSYDLTQVPKWLQEAATIKALTHLATMQAVTEAGIKLDRRILHSQYAAIINGRLRYAPLAVLPL